MLVNNRLLIAIFIASWPRIALADEPAPIPQADIAFIRRSGIPAPFPGVLLTDSVYASMLVEKEVSKERAENKLKLELGLLDNKLSLQTNILQNSLESLQQSSADRLKIKDDRITELEKQLVDSKISDLDRLLWVATGAAAVILGALAVHLVGNAGN